MSTNITEILNLLSTVNSIGPYGSRGNLYQAGISFGSALQNQLANRMKKEIYDQFQISVGSYSNHYSCYIPSDVLCRMNADKALKEKVFNMLEKYSGEEFKESMMGQGAAKKCTLTFDEEGEVTVTLKTGEKQSLSDESARLLYQKYFMQQAALLSYRTNMFGGYYNLW